MADHVYCKLRARIGEADQYHYLYALVDTGNQARDTIMSEKIFEKNRTQGRDFMYNQKPPRD